MPNVSFDVAGIGNADGRFIRVVQMRNCGIVVYESRNRNKELGLISLSNEKRRELIRWLSDGGKEPAWWSGWPGMSA
jgi:hypothetical protein